VAVVQDQAPLEGEWAVGHEGVAEVVDVGSDVTSVRPADRVVVPFQISRGGCGACRRGLTG
jgi:threonine dehydrogenase-like Zn-dependent dehydrogenase